MGQNLYCHGSFFSAPPFLACSSFLLCLPEQRSSVLVRGPAQIDLGPPLVVALEREHPRHPEPFPLRLRTHPLVLALFLQRRRMRLRGGCTVSSVSAGLKAFALHPNGSNGSTLPPGRIDTHFQKLRDPNPSPHLTPSIAFCPTVNARM